ncbi:Predicted N-acetyltransferase YhbS [Gracilibacillus orientalis]|uniref:Predicted N-acetyltransferase YhbS n=1 Tax=Gracilibacillus orientalis TaxID=334253 RepID=A0A1I4MYJ5_9BACI|nr:GNAT family N-acetyltransferase [Gracilibacillus orientalis]SFM08155.1 Predicted N-acetyltransferase YhbS [Gracilibacillus orientalis]
MRFTERTLRVLKNAEKEAEKTTKIVYPVHLLLGMLLERTAVGAELYITYPKLRDILNERVKGIYFNNDEQGISCEPFTINISLFTEQVLEIANNRMKRFKQIYLNEGHLVDAIFRNNDYSTSAIFDGLDVSRILEIVSHPRDMIVSLKDYSFPNIPTSNMTFRKAEQIDATSLKNFVEKEFGNGWLDSIENGFSKENIPLFIALDDEEIIGFACFDVVRNKKGLFGPMGTTYSKRVQGIGYTLLHLCLSEMNEIGYEYAVIGEAGPIEFYEKACNAVVIPKPL